MEKRTIWIYNGEAFVLIINSVLALSLNAIIGYLIYCNRALQTSFNATILNASIADIVVSLNLLITTSQSLAERGEKTINTSWCPVTGFINLLSFVASVMSLAAVSVNRYFLVCRSHLYSHIFSKTGTAIYIALVWCTSALISSPPFYGWSRFSYNHGKSVCFADWQSSNSYMVFMIAICFCGPIAATVVSLLLILRVKGISESRLESNQSDVFGESKAADQNLKARRKRKEKDSRRITISVAAVVIVFFIAWGPFVTVMFTEVFWDGVVPRWADMGSFLLGCLNSTANPIIYITVNTNFRKAFRQRFCSRIASELTQKETTLNC